MRALDLVVLLACLVALFLSFPSMHTYRLQPVWELPIDAAAAYRNGHTPEEWEKLPPMLATDLDGDGNEDLVYVTADYRLRIVDGWSLQGLTEEGPDVQRHDGHSSAAASLHLAEPEAAYEASLLPKFSLKYGRRPVALQAGFLDPEDDEDYDRRQVIVVLTEGWIVMCFSSTLELLWESHAVEEPDPLAFFKEASISISPTPVRNGDRGLVVVAGRMASKDKEPEAGHEHFDKEEFAATERDLMQELLGDGLEELTEERRQQLIEQLESGRREELEMQRREEQYLNDLKHFSYFAFEGHTGEERWRHTANDFKEDAPFARKDIRRSVLAAVDENDMAVRNHLLKNMRHIGEQEWYTFSDDLLEELPHLWSGREHTSLTSRAFSKDRASGGVPDNAGWDDDEDDIFGAANSVLNSYYYAPPAKKTRSPPANVLVAHNEDGVEVLHYYTGRPLTRLFLSSGSTHADINGDELIDRLDVIPKLFYPEGERNCVALARSGMPASEVLWEAQLCEDKANKKRRNKLKLGKDVRTSSVDIHMLPPVVVPKDKYTANVVYLLSDGRLVCLSEHGEQVWSTQTVLTWRDPSSLGKQKKATKFVLKGSHPSLNIIPRHDGSPSHHLLAVGSNAMAVLSAKTGEVEFTSGLPAMPVGPVVFADWDKDGASDFIVPTGAAHLAFKIEPVAPGHFLYPAVILLLIAIVLLVACATSSTRKQIRKREKYGL